MKIGPPRVWLKSKDAPGLAMTRSFGDQTAHTIGCTHIPDITLFSFTKNDRCIILASDGIWQFLSNYDVSLLIYKFYLDQDPEGAAEALIRSAAQKWHNNEKGNVCDDITCVIIFLD
jgi:serine/threonine protein phosphatase PrpC